MERNDRPRVSRSYSTVQQALADGIRTLESVRPLIAISADTFKAYSEQKKRAGFHDDNGFLRHLLALDKKDQGNKISSHECRSEISEKSHKSAESGDAEEPEAAEDVVSEEKVKDKSVESVEVKTSDVEAEKGEEIEDESGEKKKVRIEKPEDKMSVGGQDFTGDARDHEATPEDEELQFCPRCKAEMASSALLEKHLQTCDILAKYKKRQLPRLPHFFYCRWCGMRFNDTKEYKKHYDRYHVNHSDYYTCMNCDKKQAFTEKRGLVIHKYGDPVCESCQKRYTGLDMLKIHLKNKNHDKKKKKESSTKSILKKSDNAHVPHVPPVLEAVEKSEPSNLPHGFSFMSVRLNPLHRPTDNKEERLLHIPETAYRQGYTLRVDFDAVPFPELPKDDDEEDGN